MPTTKNFNTGWEGVTVVLLLAFLLLQPEYYHHLHDGKLTRCWVTARGIHQLILMVDMGEASIAIDENRKMPKT